MSEYSHANREKLSRYGKVRYAKNADAVKERVRKYAKENREKLSARNRKYVSRNLNKVRKYKREWYREKRASDPTFRFICGIRHITKEAFKRRGYRKSSRAFEVLGAPHDIVMAHIESLFRDGMSWDNYGKWHIDHIVPLATAVTKQDVIKLSHYTNLQPLWAIENLRKGKMYAPRG